MNPLETLGTLRPMARPERGNNLPVPTSQDARLMEAAQKLEAGFLAEMLTSAGLGAPRGEFGGGAGEEHFSSFMVEAQAREMVAAGGIGLAQSLFEAMKARETGGE
jgi:peptidoglycan hydrolase FlgJ